MNDWAGDWTNKTDDEVFTKAGEQPGSPASYWREVEMKRRSFLLEKKVAEATIRAAEHQMDAAEATIETARWTRISAIGVLLTVIVTGLGIILNGL